jgi:signal transduction histidine kinase
MARVLVVDDQAIPRRAVGAILRDAGNEIETAASGPEGLRLAREWSPDVIILDVKMPEMDGFEVVERLKQDPDTAPTPVIFLTADSPTDDLIVRGLELGAYDFLSKGCSRAELLARVGVMARIKRGNDELSAIARISDTLIQSLDPQELATRFVGQVRGIFRADAVLFHYSTRGEEDCGLAVSGLDPDDPLADALSATLLELLQREDDPEIEPADVRGAGGVLLRRNGFRSVLAVRLESDERAPMLLAVFARRVDGFARGSDGPLLELLARQASIALDNALLHARTREQAVRMEEQAERLERAMSERSRFFASMSHELRTPINAVIGYNELLELGTFGEMNEAQRDAVARVSRSANHLLELINDILDISKIEAGKLEVVSEPTDLSRLLHDTVTSVELQAERKGLALRVEAPETAEATTDAARVRQILLNLLSNAVKFTEQGRVEATLERADGMYEFRVEDTGPGIPPEDRERIFEEFEQTHPTGPQVGTGLGLPISRRLAHLLGGELLLQSELGRGSTFVLRLPSRSEAKRAETAEQSPATAS